MIRISYTAVSILLLVQQLNFCTTHIVLAFSPTFVLQSKYHHPSTTISTSSTSSSSLSMVSIGLGPMEKEQKEDVLVAGVDYEIPNHEEYRTSRRSKLDEQCDQWYEKLLYNGEKNSDDQPTIPTGCLKGIITDKIIEQLTTPVPLINDVEKPRDDEEWTPYVTAKLPWTPLVPSYGLEQFSLPIPRRNSEQWRHFDIPGMININYSGSAWEETTKVDTASVQEQLISSGVWVSDDTCDARLVYINGKFCNELSKSSATACNLNSAHLDNDKVVQYLQRLTDGFTDELVHPVYVDDDEPLLTSIQKLSIPNHNVGLPTSQFAMNTQQGTACFAALNTLKCQDVAYVHAKRKNSDDDHNDMIVSILNVVTKHVSTAKKTTTESSSTDDGVSIHPRTLIIADADTKLSIIQNNVDLHDNDNKQHTPKLINGYTQVFLDQNANVSHTYLNEYGGDYVTIADNNEEDIDSRIEEGNKNRSELRDTVFETIDTHVNGGYYKSTTVSFPSCGRVKMAQSITLLKEGSECCVNGLSVSGSGCRTDIKTNIHHIGSGCTSRQLQKNLVGGKLTTTSFRGRIRVEQSAQQTDSQQLSRTVLLSDKQVRAWNVPSLEIIADDVKCTHGATVSDLSEEELFYLRSRGIDPISARNILMYAFCEDVVSQTVDTSSSTTTSAESDQQSKLQQRISKRLKQLVPRGQRAVKGEFQSI